MLNVDTNVCCPGDQEFWFVVFNHPNFAVFFGSTVDEKELAILANINIDIVSRIIIDEYGLFLASAYRLSFDLVWSIKFIHFDEVDHIIALFILTEHLDLADILNPPLGNYLAGLHILEPCSAPFVISNIDRERYQRVIGVHLDLVHHCGLEELLWDPVDLCHV